MKKLLIGAAVFALAGAALRRFGPAIHELAMRKCGEMFESLPDDLPPKRMVRGIEEIRDQNSRILRALDENRSVLATVPEGG